MTPKHHPSSGQPGFSRRDSLKLFGAAALALAHPGLLAVDTGWTQKQLDSSYLYFCPELIEITAAGPIIRPDGTSQCSWSRRPFLDLNFEDARFFPLPYFQRYRMKKWDMYHLITPAHYLSFLVAWIGYGAFCSAYVYDRRARQGREDISLKWPRPELKMMRNSTAGRTEYSSRKVKAVFAVEGERRRLSVDFPRFAGLGLQARIDLEQPPDLESICGVHLTNPRRAHYGHKINCMPARGELRLGADRYRLLPEDSLGMLDFGRGYYPPKLFWYWAVSSGRLDDGKLIGFNLGHGNSPTGTAENAVFYDGRLHKIGVVHCQCDNADLMKPWRVWSDDGRVDLTLTPETARPNNLNLGFLYTVGRQALGLYSGTVTLDSGKVIPIRDLFGLFEWVDQKW